VDEHLKQAPEMIAFARELRQNLSLPEVLFWKSYRALEVKPVKLRKQHPVLGLFFLDFACPEVRLAIEIDGETHSIDPERDVIRDELLAEDGWKVIRIPARQVLDDPNAVVQHVMSVCSELKKG
jgi:very-short-patch-repair endonuclease